MLKKQPNNIAAAHGVGCVLAEAGHLTFAKQIFIQLREADSSLVCVWVNLAHIHMLSGEYIQAVKLYSGCNRKFFHNTNVELHVLESKGYFEIGISQWIAMAKSEPVSRLRTFHSHLLKSRRCLLRAIHMKPHDSQLYYNLASTLLEMATTVCGSLGTMFL